MVVRAEEYWWSSAAAYCGLKKKNPVLTKEKEWIKAMTEVSDWSQWLAETDEPEKLKILRRNINKGLPCGSEAFIDHLSRKIGRSLKFLQRGRPWNKEDEEKG